MDGWSLDGIVGDTSKPPHFRFSVEVVAFVVFLVKMEWLVVVSDK